jgi:hypothetical protein
VIYCSFQKKKISIRITKKKYVFLFENFFFDSLALKLLGLYANLLDPSAAYSEPFNLVYK